ncbi:ABC transporter permease [Edaphobacter albus]|uniref:ABC transporter permease n=1 Tax=Edaphobacter sp. 4G125 TaxID=2763071 RepID=UPI00164672D0|nr:ABC transporter permease [Edaphobacter sp. 4G125]QNI37110.1 ABC transporter permease [Edaphobacter sp. 4G125]
MSSGIHELLGRLRSLFRRRRLDREMVEELEFHQEQLRSKYLREGMPEEEAKRAVRKRFGDQRRWQERLREVWQFRWFEDLTRDVRFSARLLMRSPGFTTIALLTLALGVGANTAVFSLINGLLLRPLPVPDAQQMTVLHIDEGGSLPNYSFCTPFFRALENKHDVFANVFAFNDDVLQVRGEAGNENIPGVLVSGQYFAAMQVAPLLGRYLTPQDDKVGGNPEGLAVVISEPFWERWFHREPDVIGRKLVIANTPFTVVGVMPKWFTGAEPTMKPEIFAPLSADPIIDAPRDHINSGVHSWWLTVMARLAPGATLQQANALLVTVSEPILHAASDDAEYIKDEEGHFRFGAEPGSNGFAFARYLFRKPLVTMFAMCVGILLLACLNLTSLLMARGASRERELATRLALGATRRRLVRQLLMESLLLAGVGTALGLVVAPMVSHTLAAMLLGGRNIGQKVALDTSIDMHVFFFSALIALTAALLIGLVPALRATGNELNEQIKEGQHTSRAPERRKLLPRALMATQVALALVLVAGAGLLATSLVRLYRSGLGFDPRGVVNIAFSMDKQQLEGDELMQLYRQIGDGLRTQPGVKEVSFESQVPLSGRGWNANISSPGAGEHVIWMNSVGSDYFKTMRIPLYKGREFNWNDTKASGPKIILNKAAAKQFFPDGEAIGRQVTYVRLKTSYEVVGIVGDTKYKDVRRPAAAVGYLPMQQDLEKKTSLTAVVRVDGPWGPMAAASRSLASRLAPSIPAPIVYPSDELVDNSLGTERMMAVLGIFFALCALLVTAIGLYGTLAYATSRRTAEIGIRMALGAQRSRVMAMVFRENAVVAAMGCVAGLVAAIMLSKLLVSFLYETPPRDPLVFGGSILLLTTIACAASFLPALRAARIEPISAIRYE